MADDNNEHEIEQEPVNAREWRSDSGTPFRRWLAHSRQTATPDEWSSASDMSFHDWLHGGPGDPRGDKYERQLSDDFTDINRYLSEHSGDADTGKGGRKR